MASPNLDFEMTVGLSIPIGSWEEYANGCPARTSGCAPLCGMSNGTFGGSDGYCREKSCPPWNFIREYNAKLEKVLVSVIAKG